MNEEILKTVRLLNGNLLSVISTDRQIKNGTIMVEDNIFGTQYTIHKSGYVRKRVYNCWPFNGHLEHYQLNPIKRTRRPIKEFDSYNIDRILFPGEYLKLAGIVVRVAIKTRARLKKLIILDDPNAPKYKTIQEYTKEYEEQFGSIKWQIGNKR